MNGFELQYRDIVQKIIAETYLDSVDGDLFDLKVYCFHGRVESILFLQRPQTNLQKMFFDRNWVKLPYRNIPALCEAEIERPKNLELFIYLAETLAAGFNHVRVDFYLLNDGSLRFGEMTFTSIKRVRRVDTGRAGSDIGRLKYIARQKKQYQCLSCRMNRCKSLSWPVSHSILKKAKSVPVLRAGERR